MTTMDKQEEGGKGEGRETSEEEEGKKKKKSEAGPNYYLHPSRRGRVWEGGDGMVRKGRGQEGAPSGYPPLDVVRDEDWSSCVGWMGRGVDMARARAAPVFLSPDCTSPIPVPCPLPPVKVGRKRRTEKRGSQREASAKQNTTVYIHFGLPFACLLPHLQQPLLCTVHGVLRTVRTSAPPTHTTPLHSTPFRPTPSGLAGLHLTRCNLVPQKGADRFTVRTCVLFALFMLAA